MILKSIKWRLQLWYGLVLVLVLAGFGFTAYQLERGRLLGRIDDELHRRAGILANVLRRPPPRGPEGNAPPFDRPPPGQFPDDGPPGQSPRPPLEFHMPPQAIVLFGTNDVNNFFFRIRAINSRGDKEIARSENYRQPPVTFISAHEFDGVNYMADPSEKPSTLRPIHFEEYYEIENWLPSGEVIEVGCSIAPELKELRRTALALASVGGIILFFGLAGGGWLVSRSIKPVSNISAAAVKIAAGDLSQRIDVAEAESELGQLAAVLNSTFARLETAFAQQRQFAADAAHELRTPVSVLLTQTQTALNREREVGDYKQTVEACQRAAQRMRKLIESLLALARFDAGQEVLRRSRFDGSKMVSDCAEMLQPLAEERGVKVLHKLEPLEINGDAERLAQVVTNLLTNAIQYNKRDGEVRVKLESEGGLAVLAVNDTGKGIAAADLPRVFGRFFRADASRTGDGNAGLGLAISKAIVEAHGGTIEVASEQNVGTTLTVRLPIA